MKTKINTLWSLLCGSCLWIAASLVHAQQILPDRMVVHPYYPSTDGPFLVEIRDEWPNSCGGTITVQVSANLVQILARETVGPVCAQVITPFRMLINVREEAPEGLVFGSEVSVRYDYSNGQTQETRQRRDLGFDQFTLDQVLLQSGGWVTTDLESSGLFIDQQGDVLTAALFDYDEQGRAAWSYGVGQVDQNTAVLTMQTFGEVFCVTQPCPRAQPMRSGTLSMVLEDRNSALVRFQGALTSTRLSEDRSYVYQRLDFSRNPVLASISDSVAVPDLTGDWVAGLKLSAGQLNAFSAWRIQFSGSDVFEGRPRHRFEARSVSDPSAAPFRIDCSLHPNAPVPFCNLSGFVYGAYTCSGLVSYPAVGETRVTSRAVHCSAASFPTLAVPFEMFKLD